MRMVIPTLIMPRPLLKEAALKQRRWMSGLQATRSCTLAPIVVEVSYLPLSSATQKYVNLYLKARRNPEIRTHMQLETQAHFLHNSSKLLLLPSKLPAGSLPV